MDIAKSGMIEKQFFTRTTSYAAGDAARMMHNIAFVVSGSGMGRDRGAPVAGVWLGRSDAEARSSLGKCRGNVARRRLVGGEFGKTVEAADLD